MTIETASKAIDFMFKTPSPAIKVEFQGGEPLLNFELVQYVVNETKKRNLQHNKNLSFVIATTLSLLDDDVLAFCKKHDIHLSSSLDGPRELHNHNRPRHGRDSYERFIVGLDKARNMLGFDKVSALMTTTEESLKDVRTIIDEYVKLKFDGIFLRALSPYGHAIKRKRYDRYDAHKWLEFYKNGLDYIIELNRNGVPFIEHYATIILQKILTSNDAGYVDLMNPSGAGIAAVVFNYDGDVYASDESRMLAEMGDKTFRLGNLHVNSYKEIMLNDALLDTLEASFTLSAPMCSDCAFEAYCGAEPVYHHAMFGDVLGKKYESDFCYKNMAIFKHLINLMESDATVKALFMRWANRC
jgi:His-Xaa-Ser system radical SAM maturase HxsB